MGAMLENWTNAAQRLGVPMPYLAGEVTLREIRQSPNVRLLDSWVAVDWPTILGRWALARKRIFSGPTRVEHTQLLKNMRDLHQRGGGDPVVLTGWDNTPRRGRRGWLIKQFDVEAMRAGLVEAVRSSGKDTPPEVLWLKSWNEWTEGNYLEPDGVNGRARLEAVRDGITQARNS